MKIETLPLLSSDFAKWTWYGTNGVASEDAVKLSYRTLENKDLCSRFLREVWNDMVRLLNTALTTAGFQWDPRYGDLENTLFDTSLRINREFKASMFNAMVLNINQLGIFHWNWERTNDVPGFIGRTYVRGYAEYGNASDYIYGWYILELAEKLNKFIAILKNEAPFREYAGIKRTETISESMAAAGGARSLERMLKEGTAYTAPLAIARIIEGTAAKAEYSHHKGIIVPIQPLILPGILFENNSLVKAAVERAKVQEFESGIRAKTFSGTELKGVPFIGRMMYEKPIMANYLASVDVFNICELEYAQKAESKIYAFLKDAKPYPLNMTGNVASYDKAEIVFAERLLMNAETKSDSRNEAEMILKSRKIMSSTIALFSGQISSMSYRVPLYMQRKIQAKSCCANEMSRLLPKPIEKKVCIQFLTSAIGETHEAIPISKTLHSRSHDECDISAVRIKDIVSDTIAGSSSVKCGADAALSLPAEKAEKSASHSAAEILKGIPAFADGCSGEQSSTKSEIKTIESISVKGSAVSRDMIVAELMNCQAKKLSSRHGSRSKAVGVLELEASKGKWCAPVRTENNLHIHSVWAHYGEETNVHIGHKFLDAVQSGNNLHIRSIYTEKSADGNIDLRFKYYEPVQKNGNIYIRSIENLKKGE